MRLRCLLLIAMPLAAAPCFARADDAPKSISVRHDSPEAVVESWLDATAAGDIAAKVECYEPRYAPIAQHALQDIPALVEYLQGFADRVQDRLGKGPADLVRAHRELVAYQLPADNPGKPDHRPKLTVHMDGDDKAEVRLGSGHSFRLRRIDGKWYFDMLSGPDVEMRQRRLAQAFDLLKETSQRLEVLNAALMNNDLSAERFPLLYAQAVRWAIEPMPVAIDASSPKGLLATVATAQAAGNGVTLIELAKPSDGFPAVNSALERNHWAHLLAEAVDKKIGSGQAQQVRDRYGHIEPFPPMEQIIRDGRIDWGQVEILIDGNTATARIACVDNPVKMIRGSDGRWAVAAPGDKTPRQPDNPYTLGQALRDLTDAVNAGQVTAKNWEEAFAKAIQGESAHAFNIIPRRTWTKVADNTYGHPPTYSSDEGEPGPAAAHHERPGLDRPMPPGAAEAPKEGEKPKYDQSSPRALLGSMNKAAGDRDYEGLFSLLSPDVADALKPVTPVLAKLLGKMVRVAELVSERIDADKGRELSRQFAGNIMPLSAARNRDGSLDWSKISITGSGNSLKVKIEGSHGGLILEKFGQRWYWLLDEDDFTAAKIREEMPKFKRVFPAMLAAFTQLEAGLLNGSINASNFDQKLGEIMMAAMREGGD
ncbi:MAG: hypothetical protein BIFFINMI_01701 [Phycisphaerae bacterium]|nr:hypothetical protein [Phycisphaerae bacterium]